MSADEDSSEVRLLSGGNPQIPKGDGDEPVQAYIAAMPGWKGGIGRHIDQLVAEEVPGVRYLDIHEDDAMDDGQLRDWIRQAASMPGEETF